MVFLADTNNIIILYPQTVPDNTLHTIWGGYVITNSNACWDWVGYYGQNPDQKGGELSCARSALTCTANDTD